MDFQSCFSSKMHLDLVNSQLILTSIWNVSYPTFQCCSTYAKTRGRHSETEWTGSDLRCLLWCVPDVTSVVTCRVCTTDTVDTQCQRTSSLEFSICPCIRLMTGHISYPDTTITYRLHAGANRDIYYLISTAILTTDLQISNSRVRCLQDEERNVFFLEEKRFIETIIASALWEPCSGMDV